MSDQYQPQGMGLEENRNALGDIVSGLGAGAYSAGNNLLLGLPDFLVKTISDASKSDTYQKLQDWRNQNKTASDIGGVVGDVGSFLLPGGIITKGIGSGLKGLSLLGKGAEAANAATKLTEAANPLWKAGEALTNVGKGIETGQGMGAFQRGALGALEQAVPRSLIQAGTTGDFSNVPGDIATSGALGGVLGKGLGYISNKFPRFNKNLQELANQLDQATLSGAEISSKGFKNAINSANRFGYDPTGFTLAQEQEMKQALGRMITSNNAFSKVGKDELIEKVSGNWKDLDEAWNKAGVKLNDIKPQVMADPEISALLNAPGNTGIEAKAALEDLIGRLGDQADLPSLRKGLMKAAQLGFKAVTPDMQTRGEMALALRNHIDNIADNLLPEDTPKLAQMKQDWKIIQPLRRSLAISESRIENPFAGGSDTAAKLATMGAMGAGGAALGGFDPNDPSTWAKVGAGLVGGRLLANTLPKMAGKLIGRGAGMLRGALPDTAEGLSNMVQGAAGTIPGKVIPEITKKNAEGQAANEDLVSQEAGPEPGGMAPQEVPAIQSGAASGPAPIPGTPAAQAPATAPPGATPGAHEAMNNPTYVNRVSNTLQNDYKRYFAPSGMKYEDFVNQVYQQTNGFDPKLMAPILFKNDKQAEQFTKDYQTVENLKKLNLAKASEYQGLSGLIGGDILGNMPEAKTQAMNLQNLFSNLVASKPGELPNKETVDQIKNNISAIMRGNSSPQAKQRALINMLGTSYGVNINRLQSMGLI